MPMPTIRNPFARKQHNDENQRPRLETAPAQEPQQPGGFDKVDTIGSKSSSIAGLSINSGRSNDTGEYKLSVVNDSGVYLPPSPVEKSSPPWPARDLSRNSSDKSRGSLSTPENEHFTISRESFDSYRRSFDISARSPVTKHDAPTRQSFDSSRFPRPRLSMNDRRPEPTTVEESFEDVGLGDDRQPKGVQQMQQQQMPQPQKKRGFFSKFGNSEPQTDGILLKAQD